jgi:hypothetical protein
MTPTAPGSLGVGWLTAGSAERSQALRSLAWAGGGRVRGCGRLTGGGWCGSVARTVADWPTPEMLAVYDPTRVPAPSAKVGADWADVSTDELRARQERVQQHRAELAAQGVFLFGHTAAGQLRYIAMAPDTAERLLRERFGAEAEFMYLGASRRALRPHPFGSWLADGLALHVFYGLPQNGECLGGSVVAEDTDCVIVSLMIVDWLGAKTLVGGVIPSHATVTLQTELGDRTVVDNFDNHPRPHWKTAAAVPVPRPQDL